MFIKIEQGETTLGYEADHYAFSHKGDLPIPQESTEAAITIWRDEVMMVDYPLKKYSSVYIMNDSGKTIDSFRVG